MRPLVSATARRPLGLTLVVVFTAAVPALADDDRAETAAVKKGVELPAGLPAILYPEDNQPSPEKVALGQQLYFDPRLSADGTVSCASCHDPEKGWSNGDGVATGVGGQKGGRSAPTIINSVFNKMHFWDGRAATLEEQALGPIANPIEMNLPVEEAVKRLNQIEGYREQFRQVFGTECTEKALAQAISAYERTIVSGNAPYDRFVAGDESALSEAAQRGRQVFFNKAHCSACHNPPNFTDHAFHNVGIGMHAKDGYDKGREVISKLEGDRGSFKTPTLREIARTAPYMHDGSLKTLEEVVEYYAKGGTPNEWLDEEIYPLKLTAEDKADLVVFLKEGLSSPDYPLHKAPKLPE